jgi:hypothetical protein
MIAPPSKTPPADLGRTNTAPQPKGGWNWRQCAAAIGLARHRTQVLNPKRVGGRHA